LPTTLAGRWRFLLVLERSSMSSAAVVNSVSKPFWIAVSDGHRQMSLAAAGLAMQARMMMLL